MWLYHNLCNNRKEGKECGVGRTVVHSAEVIDRSEREVHVIAFSCHTRVSTLLTERSQQVECVMATLSGLVQGRETKPGQELGDERTAGGDPNEQDYT